MKKFLIAIPVGVPSVIITVLIIYLSLSPNPFDANKIQLFNGADKVVHGIMYFFAAAVYILDYAKFKLPHHTRVNLELAFTATAGLIGGLLEVAQLIMQNGRTYDPMDWLSDLVGAALAFLLIHFWFMHKFRKYLYYSIRPHRHRRHTNIEIAPPGLKIEMPEKPKEEQPKEEPEKPANND
jgi:VanZ family protein